MPIRMVMYAVTVGIGIAQYPRDGKARAERISWIGQTLSNPDIEVCQDPHPDGDRRRYLWQVPADPDKGLKQEYHCVIVQNIDDFTVSFITSYDLDRKQWLKYRSVKPRYYPIHNPQDGENEEREIDA